MEESQDQVPDPPARDRQDRQDRRPSGYLLRFNDGRYFLITHAACANPDCPAIHLAFRETRANGATARGGMRFDISLDIGTWREANPGARTPAERRIVDEFLRDLDDDAKREYRLFHEEIKQDAKITERLSTHVFSRRVMKRGSLVAFSEILDELAPPKEGKSISFVFRFENVQYYIQDLYCPAPRCPCREVHLAFLKDLKKRPGRVLTEIFRAFFQLDGGCQYDRPEDPVCSLAEARRLVDAFLLEYPDAPEILTDRYEHVKRIGERSEARYGMRSGKTAGQPDIKRQRAEPDGTIVAKKKPGPNDPCPCGSGKN